MARKRIYTAANKAIAQARFTRESTNPARDIARKSKFPKSIAAYHPNRNDWPGVDTPGSALPGTTMSTGAAKKTAAAKKVTGKRKRSKSRSRSRATTGPKKPRKKRAKKGTKTPKKAGKKGKRGKGKRAKRTGPPRPLSDEQRAWHAHVKATQARIGGSYREAMKEASKTYNKGFQQNIVARDKDAALYAKVVALRDRAAKDPESLTDEEHLFLINNWPEAEDNRTIQEMFTPAQRAAMDRADWAEQTASSVPSAIASLPANPPAPTVKVEPRVKIEPGVRPKGVLKIRKHDIPMVNKSPYELHKEVQKNLLEAEQFNAMRRAKISSANFRLQQYINSKGGRLKTNSALWAERNRKVRLHQPEGVWVKDRQRGMPLYEKAGRRK